MQIGNWSRWLTDKFDMDSDDSEDIDSDDDEKSTMAKSKSFQLLNELSDLLMLPKDMLLEKSVRKEVSIYACVRQIIPFYIHQLSCD